MSLRDRLSEIGATFRLPSALLNLAQSIRGFWKTELFLGSADFDRWVGASVSINRWEVPAATAPRIAIIPSMAGHSDAVRLDEQKNIIICPVPHDGSFIQIFHEGWKIVQALCARNFEMPENSDFSNPLYWEVARIFAERREFPIAEAVEATRKFAQPELLTTRPEIVPSVPFRTTVAAVTSTIITPIARTSITPPEIREALTHPAG